jgi:parallel beta-helix repeat protein
MNIQFRKTNLVRSMGIVILLFLGLVISSPVAASSGTMYIYTDTTLSENHHGNIEIMADDVNLDCAGHSVIGSGSGIGIHLVGRTGVKVENCRATNFTYGFLLSSSSNNVLEGNIANKNSDDGFVLQDFSNGNILKENSARNTKIWSGFWLRESSNNILRENIASSNKRSGFSVARSSNYNEFSENKAINNEGGFVTHNFSNNNRFIENVAERNSWTGFLINDSFNGVYIDNVAVGNLEGFKFRRSSRTLLKGNTAVGNKTDGFSFMPGFDSFDNTLLHNAAEKNHGNGFHLNNNAYRTNLMFNTGCRNHDLDALDESSAANMNFWSDNDFCNQSIVSTGGAISGVVTDLESTQLAGIFVNACQYDNPEPFCTG